MAFTVEDGTGIANANSLVSVAFADNYHAERGNSGWTDIADETTKQQLLIKATDYFVDKFGLVLLGDPVASGQALPYPRYVYISGVKTNVGNPIGLQRGIAELALIAKTTPLVPSVTRGKKRVKIGPIDIEYDGSSPVATQFTAAVMKFAPYLSSYASGAMAKLVRC